MNSELTVTTGLTTEYVQSYPGYGNYVGTPPSGSLCNNCGQWITPYSSHQCYVTPYVPPTYVIPNVYFQTYPTSPVVLPDPAIAELREEVAELRKTLEILVDLLHNRQDDKEVRGHTEGACESVDSGGVPGTPGTRLEAPKCRGDWTWPRS